MPVGQAKFGLLGGVDPGKLKLLETKTLSTAAAEFTSLEVVHMKHLIMNLLIKEVMQVAHLLKEKVYHKQVLDCLEI